MPRYPGIKVYEDDRVSETRMTVDKLFRNQRMKDLVKPNIQCALDDDKVEEMRSEYREKPEMFRSKNKLIIGNLNDTWYLVDGQHRYEMLRREFEENKEIKEDVSVIWYKFSDEEYVNELFCSINKDSVKNKNYIDVGSFAMVKINEFMNLLRNYHADAFNKTKSAKSARKALEELRDDLMECGFFDNPKLSPLSSTELYEYFITKNDEFYKSINYENFLIFKPTLFYEKERTPLQEKIIFTTKYNNFIKWICHDEEPAIPCVHYFRKEKKKIPPALRTAVWRTYYGDTEVAPCPISFCKKLISRKTHSDSDIVMHCGHIISEKNGGATATHNLRPLCSRCNCEMGDSNWEIFDKTSYNTRNVL